jgi:hypothetical protein
MTNPKRTQKLNIDKQQYSTMNTNKTQTGSIDKQQQNIIKGCQGTPIKDNKEAM